MGRNNRQTAHPAEIFELLRNNMVAEWDDELMRRKHAETVTRRAHAALKVDVEGGGRTRHERIVCRR